MSEEAFRNHMTGIVKETVDRLMLKDFEDDPLLPGKYSKISSIVGSAYKRHGFVLEQAILFRLKQNESFVGIDYQKFGVTASAESLVSTFIDREGDALDSDLPYLVEAKDQVRTIQFDCIVYVKSEKTLVTYEIKRGNGLHDSGKRRSMKRDLLIQQTLLKSYGTKRGLDVKKVDSKIIFYYGQCSLPPPFSLTGKDLDLEFGFELQRYVEIANSMLATSLEIEIEKLINPSIKELYVDSDHTVPIDSANAPSEVKYFESPSTETSLRSKGLLSRFFKS